MKKLLIAATLLFLSLLIPSISGAQGFIHFYPPAGSLTMTGPLLLSDGTVAAPGLGFALEPGLGISRSSVSIIQFNYNNSGRFAMIGGTNQFQAASSSTFSWSSGAVTATSDLFLSRGGAATLQQGAADAAAPVNQTLQAQGVAAGTSDVAGANFTIRPGIGRGLAVPGVLTLNRSLVTTTGNSAQAQSSGMVICGTKTLSTTTTQAQTVVTVTTTTLSAGGLTLYYNVSATSATAADATTGSAHVSWNNIGGTVNAVMSAAISETQSNSSGTLAAIPTVTVATNVVSIKLTPTWVTIVPTAVRGSFTVLNQGIDPIACQ
jgi:hypothetical protein